MIFQFMTEIISEIVLSTGLNFVSMFLMTIFKIDNFTVHLHCNCGVLACMENHFENVYIWVGLAF